MMQRKFILAAAVSLATLGAASAANAQQTAPQAAAEASASDGEIIVTANKRRVADLEAIVSRLDQPFALFLQSDIVVKVVMLGLLAASVWSWAIIIDRSRRLREINNEAKRFEAMFWKAESLDGMYEPAVKSSHPSAKLFVAGLNELLIKLVKRLHDGQLNTFVAERFANNGGIADQM